MYYILTRDMIDGESVLKHDRFDPAISTKQLAYNLANFWCWNLSGTNGFESDGPCVFIEWSN